MAVIYLKHPIHGAKVATLEAEAEYDKCNGWVRYNPSDTEEVASNNTLRLKRKYVRKAEPQRKGA